MIKLDRERSCISFSLFFLIWHSDPRRYWNTTYLLHEAAFDSDVLFFFLSCGQTAIKGDIILNATMSLIPPPPTNHPSPISLVAQSKQTHWAFALAYWCPVGVSPPAQNENVHSLVPRKDVLHPVTCSSSATLLPELCFHPLLPR